MSIEKLLKKYEKPTSAERYTKKYKRELKQKQRIKNRHLLLDELTNEIPFHLTNTQIRTIRYFIDTVKDFNKLHRRCSNKTILLAMIFLLRTLDKPKTNVDEYSISKKYGLNNTNFRLIICRLNNEILKSLPITIHETKKDNYEYLEKSDK
jgi:hypothetical protein